MKGIIRRFLGLERLSDIARESSAEAFVESLLGSHLTLLGLWSKDGLEASEVTEDSLLAEIRKNCEHLQGNEQFSPLVVEEGGERRLGVFTTDADLQAFTRQYSRSHPRSFVFQTFATTGESLRYFLPLVERFVLNPASKDATPLSDAHMTLLAREGAAQ
ncbi:SseB family protein [Haloferula sp. BvORR071]|uniref:SseB family protein n=1 Tax=Haloferula sp. BvORR071 TaxID=1396141 RepID=UPI0005569622|nr:SseB family protein [Haloferula sp. BvORR071]